VKAVVELLVRELVDHPEQVEVVESRGSTPGTVRLDVHVAPEDTGKVIGRQGRIANALRTVAKAAGARQNLKVFVDIVS
jgi:predicted RNA-binding protein YlqC (UPF0109 family)